MSRPTLTLACGAYDRTAPIADGRVGAEGLDLNVVLLEPEECFFRMLRHAEFDVAEMSLSSFAIARARGDGRFVGLPVFLSRSFRHSSVYLPPGSDVRGAADLAGATIGVPEYQITAAVWVRATLQHEYGVDPAGVTWRTGGLEQPGRGERQRIDLPSPFTVEPLEPDDTLSAALRAGRLDALIAPRVPRVFREPGSGVRRMFPDYAERERAAYARSGVFPIMHLVVVRAEVHERHPWAAASLTKMFVAARDAALSDAENAPALRYSVPFVLPLLEEQRELFGDDPWPYGFDPNRTALALFLEHLGEQGLLSAPLEPEALFAPSTLELSRI